MIRRFLRAERGNVALESAIALSVLVSAFAGLMHLVGDVYAEDRMGRGVRAVARAIALNPGTEPWAVFRRELGLDESHSCPALSGSTPGTCDGWTLSVAHRVSPGSLGAALGGTAANDGEMVFVRLWKGPGGTPTPPDAIGLSRSEPEA